ncbi:MAG: hypothetical protein P1P69_07090 [Methanosarcinaceae archaeon]|nr:hypothetical protein [Methanosarcinaceae archaeon]
MIHTIDLNQFRPDRQGDMNPLRKFELRTAPQHDLLDEYAGYVNHYQRFCSLAHFSNTPISSLFTLFNSEVQASNE